MSKQKLLKSLKNINLLKASSKISEKYIVLSEY